ncbi:MAG TPA: hypothetical protein VM755_21505 [Stellaceae bacterium]|nr:hypothetical protein [Stellaceae bacterium]
MSEPDDAFRRQILELAQQYERIVEKIEGGMDDSAVALLIAAVTAPDKSE